MLIQLFGRLWQPSQPGCQCRFGDPSPSYTFCSRIRLVKVNVNISTPWVQYEPIKIFGFKLNSIAVENSSFSIGWSRELAIVNVTSDSNWTSSQTRGVYSKKSKNIPNNQKKQKNHRKSQKISKNTKNLENHKIFRKSQKNFKITENLENKKQLSSAC
jgi:hypothetical protein